MVATVSRLRSSSRRIDSIRSPAPAQASTQCFSIAPGSEVAGAGESTSLMGSDYEPKRWVPSEGFPRTGRGSVPTIDTRRPGMQRACLVDSSSMRASSEGIRAAYPGDRRVAFVTLTGRSREYVASLDPRTDFTGPEEEDGDLRRWEIWESHVVTHRW